MPVTGKQLQPREIAELCHNAGWRDKDHIISVAVCLSESGGFPQAWNDNKKLITATKVGDICANVELYYKFTIVNPTTGLVKLEDGTTELYPTTTLVITTRDVGLFQINIPASGIGTDRETALYDPVANVATAKQYWNARKWQPWYGYTNGYATSTEWWHWSTTKLVWTPTGKYLHRAIRGVANYHARKFGLEPVPFVDYYSVPPKPVNGA